MKTLFPVIFIALLGQGSLLHAQVTLNKKVLTRATVTPASNNFGSAVAVSSSFIVVGEPYSDDHVTEAGSVSLLNPTTGGLLRKLRPPAPDLRGRFGISVAAAGSLVVVGAVSDFPERGAAYVFDGNTGRKLRDLAPATLSATAEFGTSVSTSGNLVVVGALRDGAEVAGRAYVLDLSTGAVVATLASTDVTPNGGFGFSVSISGHLVAVGAPYLNSNRGAVYLFDARSGTQLRVFHASAEANGDLLGFSVSLSGNRILAGAPGRSSGSGTAYLFSCVTAEELPVSSPVALAAGSKYGYSVSLMGNRALIGVPFEPTYDGVVFLADGITGAALTPLLPNPASGGLGLGGRFGEAVALGENNVVVGSPGDDTVAGDAGAVSFDSKIGALLPMPMTVVAAKGDVAPGAGAAKFSTLSAPVISGIGSSGRLAYLSTLTGTGAGTGGTALGLWAENAGGGSRLVARGTTSLGPFTVLSSVKLPLFNDDADVLFQGIMKPSGVVTSAFDAVLLRSTEPDPLVPLPAENSTFPGLLGGAAVSAILEQVQNYDFTGRLASAVKLKSTVATRVTGANDTGVLAMSNTGVASLARTEGEATSVGSDTRYGQIVPRVAIMKGNVAWTSALMPGPTTPPGTVTTSTNQILNVNGTTVWRSGDLAATGANYRSFIATTVSLEAETTFKATLTGATVNTANNEGIYRYGVGQVARKGDLVDPVKLPGIKISRIVKFWALPQARIILLAVLSGPGVTAANDQALIYSNPYAGYQILMREGDYTEGNDRAKIGTIQKVDVEPYGGNYVIVASLVSSSTRNLALFTGRTHNIAYAPLPALLTRPGMRLRKGTGYSAPTLPRKITTLSVTSTTDVSGAGGKGLGQAVEDNGNVGIVISFSDRTSEIRRGIP